MIAPTTEKITFPVSGMTCAACQARVQRALTRAPGVSDAVVNLMMGSATVDFDPAVATPDSLVETVRSTGYGADLPVADQSAFEAEEERSREGEAEYRGLRRKALASLGAGGVAMALSMPLMMRSGGGASGVGSSGDPFLHWLMGKFSVPVAAVAPWIFEIEPQRLLYVLFALTTGVVVFAGRHFYLRGWKAARHGSADMNTLVALGTGSAFLYSIVATFAPRMLAQSGVAPDVYYEAVIIIIALVLLGSALEARAKARTSTALRQLIALQPRTARVRVDRQPLIDGMEAEDLNEREIPIEELTPGDVVIVRPGERIAVDGVVLTGESAVDQSMLTGESMPVDKTPGARVFGGTINRVGALEIRATTLGEASALSRVVQLMREAQGTRAPIQRLADRVSAIFVPTVVGIAVLTFAIWFFAAQTEPFVRALSAGISVLIIACPCAMGLAVPTAMMVASGKAAELGVLFKGGEALERFARVDTVLLDKTGTVTMGAPAVIAVSAVDASAAGERELLRLAATVEQRSEHPIARAVLVEAQMRGIAPATIEAFQSITGRGARATSDGRSLLVGSAALMRESGIALPATGDEGGHTTAPGSAVGTRLYVAADGRVLGSIVIADPIRVESRAAIEALRARGITVVLVTGDSEDVANAIAAQASIEQVIAEVLPEGKVAAVQRFRDAGRVVAMVGDGINDAPALAHADVGIAMGSGTDIAIEAADVTVLRPELSAVVDAYGLSRRTMRTMRQNLFWAFVYNVIGIPIAAGVLVPSFGIALSPVLASAAMAMSSVSVVANSLRLKGVKSRRLPLQTSVSTPA